MATERGKLGEEQGGLILFLESIKNDLQATFDSFDKALADQMHRKQLHQAQVEGRKLKSDEEMLGISETICLEDLTDAEDTSDSDTQNTSIADPNIRIQKTTRSHSRCVRKGTGVFVPHDILKHPKMFSLATRMKMSAAEQAAFTVALVEESGGDPNKLAISYATADRACCKTTKTIAKTTREEWAVPQFATVHWDSKLMSSLSNQNVSEERLTVAVGTPSNFVGTKLLGVPSYRPGSHKKSRRHYR